MQVAGTCSACLKHVVSSFFSISRCAYTDFVLRDQTRLAVRNCHCKLQQRLNYIKHAFAAFARCAFAEIWRVRISSSMRKTTRKLQVH